MLTESGFFKEEAKAAAAAARSSVPPDLAPEILIAEKYELTRKLGTGAMGEVWAAKHLSLDEEVAIKLVLRDVKHDDGSTADSRFLLEARVARMLSRKTRHIVSVTDHGDDGPIAYLVMELLNGEPLDVRLARSGALPLEKVLPLVQQVARALSVAHDAGIVHRDLKPGNVFLSLDEEGKALIKILDFGIAKLNSTPAPPAPESGPSLDRNLSQITNRDAKHATLRGFLLGTPAYMSPEQARGKALDHRADVWALAVIAYQLLTTEYPFDGATADELFKRLIKVQPIPITDHRKDLPPAIRALFDKAFAKPIDERFQSAEDFALALEAASEESPVVVAPAPKIESAIVAAGIPRNRGRLAAVAAVALLALGGGFAYSHLHSDDPKLATGLTAGASTQPVAVAPLDRDDSIPPPPPPVEKAAAEALPAPTAEPTEAPASTVEAPPVAETAVPPPPKRNTDKSEVF